MECNGLCKVGNQSLNFMVQLEERLALPSMSLMCSLFLIKLLFLVIIYNNAYIAERHTKKHVSQ